MLDDKTIAHWRQKIDRGDPAGEIKEQLIAEGYSEMDIEKVFEPKGYDMRSWYLAFGIVFFCVGVYFYLTIGRLLGFGLSVGLFVSYYLEVKRLQKLSAKKAIESIAIENTNELSSDKAT